MKRIVLIAVPAFFAAVLATAMQTFEANLSGNQETPANGSIGTGRMVLVLNDAGNAMFYRLSVSRLVGINGAHIHQAPAGTAGPIVFPLNDVALASGPINGSFTVTPTQVADFQAGNFYVNVHTNAFPNGEIRGQIGLFAPPANFTAILTGDQETPPVTTSATGVGRFALIGGTVSYQVTVLSISNIIAAHIHQGPAGVAGPVVFPLNEAALAASGSTSGTITLGPDQLVDLLTDFYYVNVHTTANPNGEIRGQIRKRTAVVFTGNLDGAQQTPPVTTNATGKITLVLNEPMNTVFYRLEVLNISNVIDQHIHEGAPGVAGPVIFPLNGPLAPGTPSTGSFAVTAAEVNKFVAGMYYANVHTAANPGGEIRGQIGRFAPALRHSALMKAANEVPPILSNANGVIRFKLTFNADLQFTILVQNMSSSITAAHIHSGQPGIAGPVIVPLYNGGGMFDETHPFSGSASLSPDQLVDFLAGNTYANVHTVNNPGGEIRGQLRATLAGDANGDGTRTVADVFYLISHLFTGGPLPDGGDSNGDEATTVADIFYMINFLFAGGPAPQSL